MATKIRLQRHGKKGKPFFHIVAADTRSKRDGKYIERLGSYNPNTNPATIDIDFDRCLNWLKTGAERTDTANAILKYKGVVYKYHLDRGVVKGAMTQDQADAKFDKWMVDKDSKLEGQVGDITKALDADSKARFKAETDVKEARAKVLLAKSSELAEGFSQFRNQMNEMTGNTSENLNNLLMMRTAGMLLSGKTTQSGLRGFADVAGQALGSTADTMIGIKLKQQD